MRRLASFVTLVLMFVGLFVLQASADFDTDQPTCESSGSRPEFAIAACTRRINSGRLEGQALAASHYTRGIRYHDQGDLDHALADYGETIRLDPKHWQALYNRGNAYENKGDLDHAIADYDEAIRLNPQNAGVFANRSRAYGNKHDWNRAIADSNEAIRLDPKNAAAFLTRCYAYLNNGDLDRAIAECSEVIRLDPKQGMAFNNRGNTYWRKGDLNHALTDLNEALRLNPRFVMALQNRGILYQVKRDFAHAIADLDEVLRLDPEHTVAYTARGQVYEAKGEPERAKADYNAALMRPQTDNWAHDVARKRLAALASSAPVTTSPAIATPLPAAAERRVALVIGNASYRAAPVLANPSKDAKGVAETLKSAGFTSVKTVTDATREDMIRALRTFQNEADRADWAVVFYAGHGMEIGGVNYLVPTDARLKEDRDAQDEAVSLKRVLDAVSGSKKLKLVLLDACRENPFAQQMKRTIVTRAVTRGLTGIEPEGATLVVYAAKDGEVADDGNGDHSPFTAALLKRLRQPGVEINRLFRQVTGDVLQATGNHQRPFVYGSIPGDEEFFLRAQ